MSDRRSKETAHEVGVSANDLSSDCDPTRQLPSERQAGGTTVKSPFNDKPDSAGNERKPGDFIDRFCIVRTLGTGSFGRVYLADDSELNRRVSLKVPHPHCVRTEEDLESYIQEARMVAGLDHPGIVPVHDVAKIPGGLCYVVSKYIEGETLKSLTKSGGCSVADAVDIICTLADTLQYVHEQGITHRDIKPSNVLRDINGRLFVNDFGLALYEPKLSERGKIVGTPAYMSPEQASGEGHLVDGRSDIFSLGIILYEMLTGKQPFHGGGVEDVLYKIRYLETPPIRQLNRDLPKELERVCQKVLAKKTSERYETAGDLASDLRSCTERTVNMPMRRSLATDSGSGRTSVSGDRVVVIPKGLRSYEAHDANFFRSMLPGPYDLDGCPESIRFWRSRIVADEQTDPFRVGVIYGTSGCGKSSFVRAGLLPMLDSRITVCTMDATASGTRETIKTSLRRHVPQVDLTGKPIDEQFAAIRRAPAWEAGCKVLIVIDQFEQWLNSADAADRDEMVRALRQCDGDRLQAILLVRDDFWLAVSRLMDELDIEMEPNRNLAMIDLLDRPHAEKVLEMLGRAYGRIQSESSGKSRDQQAFISEAVSLLADDDRVVAVRLALFAEIMKSRPWTRATLRNLGGIEGTVERFLYESFDATAAPREQRIHQQAAHSVLQALLPESGLIRGSAVESQELLAVSGYEDKPAVFEQLLRILDSDLRLITPTETPDNGSQLIARKREADHTGANSQSDSQRGQLAKVGSYQLTHDSLVPAIRNWVSVRQRKTAAGRAALSLASRTNAWEADRQKRQLPSFLEWAQYALLTRKRHRTPPQQRLMQASNRRYGRMLAIGSVVLSLALFAGYQLMNRINADSQVRQITTATSAEAPGMIAALGKNRWWANPKLMEIRDNDSESDRARFMAALALSETDPGNTKPQATEFLRRYLATADYRTLMLATQHPPAGWEQLQQQLVKDVADDRVSVEERFRATLLLGEIPQVDSGESDSGESDSASVTATERLHESLTATLVAEALANRLQYGELVALSVPLRDDLTPSLIRTASENAGSSRQDAAVQLLRDLHADSPATLCEVFVGLSTDELLKIVPAFDRDVDLIAPTLNSICDAGGTSPAPSLPQTSRALRNAHAAAFLARLGDEEQMWKIFSSMHAEPAASDLTDANVTPETAAMLIQILPRFLSNVDSLLNRLESANSPVEKRNLLFAIGDQHRHAAQPELVDQIRSTARRFFLDDSDAGVHAAAHWLLANLQDRQWLRETRQQMAQAALETNPASEAGRNWIVSSQGITLIRLDAREHADIGIQYDMGETEVSREEFRKFDQNKNRERQLADWDDEAPAGIVSWFEAAAYCNWLTKEEGMGEDQLCYPPAGDNLDDIKLVADYRQRRGYRLPTREEWDFAWHSDPVRIACVFNRTLVYDYAILAGNANTKSHPPGKVKPDRSGFFHLTGNSLEWCSLKLGKAYVARGSFYRGSFDKLNDITHDKGYLPKINWRSAGFRIVRSVVSDQPRDHE